MKTLLLALSLALLAHSLNAAPWTTGGPRGGVIYSLDHSASNPRVVYAATVRGVFRSDDNGDTWRDASGGLKPATVVAVDPVDPNIAYLVAGATESRSAYRTTNGGARWTKMATGSLTRMNTILIDPRDPKTLYISSSCGNYFEPIVEGAGLLRSSDGGLTWRDASSMRLTALWGICVTNLSLDPANPSHLFARSDLGIGPWESFDGATTWTRTTALVPTSDVVIDPYQPSVRYGTNGSVVLRSDDDGAHWTQQPASGLPTLNYTQTLWDFSLDPVTPRIFSATDAGLFRSGDGGRSWIPAGDVPRIRINSVLFNAIDSTVMIGTTQGVFRAPSPAFTPWTPLDVPESGFTVAQIAADPKQSSIVYASAVDEFSATQTQGRIFRSVDNGATWQQIADRVFKSARLSVDASGDLWFAELSSEAVGRVRAGTNELKFITQFSPISSVAAHPSVPGLVYVGSTNGRIARTSNAGEVWAACQSVQAVIEELALDPSSDTVYAATLAGVYRSTNGCGTFERLDRAEVHAIAVAPSNPSTLYRAARDTSVSNDMLVWRSLDGGTTWTQTTPLPVANPNVMKIVVDPRNAGHVWLAELATGVWESANGGATWTNVSDGLPVFGATALAIDSAGTTLHAGVTQNGVWELRVHRRVRAVGH